MNVLITGGASGLGRAILEKLCTDDSVKIFFTYFKSASEARSIENKLTNAHGVFCDFSDAESLNNLIEKLPSMELNVLVNNAISGMEVAHFHKTPEAVFTADFMNNVLPQVRLMQECVKLFRKRKAGKLITVLTAGLIGAPPMGYASYTASKAYMASIVKTIAAENVKFNITSNAVSPSLMKTGLLNILDERIVDSVEEGHPLKQLLPLTQVAEVVDFLTKSPSHLNGVNIPINAAVNVI
ncbi:MAG: SDR family oxidoreductase [Roseivirga sp.]|nr:SDR family oxidoreductase [Roseivirga sp.]